MSWEILSLIAAGILLVLLVVFRNNPYVKKYWKYSLILIPGIVTIVIKCIIDKKDPVDNSHGTNRKSSDLAKSIDKIKDDLTETQLEAAVEVSAAKTKSKEKIEKLKEIKKIPDQSERVKRLADLVG